MRYVLMGFLLFQTIFLGAQEKVKFLLFSDLHYDIMPDAKERLRTMLGEAEKQKVDFVLELGDFVLPDSSRYADVQTWVRNCPLPVYHALGNHDIDKNSKQVYLDYWDIPASYYYFDKGRFRFIILDSDFFVDKDGEVKPYDRGNYASVEEEQRNRYSREELQWLKGALSDPTRICVLFSHAPVNDLYEDVSENNREIHRIITEARDKGTPVAGVFGGHMHSDNYHLIDGIHYIQVNSASNIWGGSQFINTDRYPADVYTRYPSLKYVIPYDRPLYAIVEIDDKGEMVMKGVRGDYVKPEADPELLKKKPYPCSPVISDLKLKFLPLPVRDEKETGAVVRIGMIADVHDQPERLQAFLEEAEKQKPDFIIQLGDLSDGTAESNNRMLTVWNRYRGRKYHVLGNHELDHASKQEIVNRQQMPAPYYSFDCGDFHFVVLDCNFILKEDRYIGYEDANYYIDKEYRDLISPSQLEWLKKDLQQTDKRVILFSHQTFADITVRGSNPVPNRIRVRQLIDRINRACPENKRKVIACFAGHDHLDHYNLMNGVHFFAVNSALGFMKGLEIKDALYQFVTLDNTRRTISIKGVQSEFMHPVEKEDFGHYPPDQILPCIRDRSVSY